MHPKRVAPLHNSFAPPPSAAGRTAVSPPRSPAVVLSDPLRRSSDVGWVSPTPAQTPAASAGPTTPVPCTAPPRFPETPHDGLSASSLNSFCKERIYST